MENAAPGNTVTKSMRQPDRGYDDPEVGWHHCPPGMGLLDTIVVEVRQDLFIQDVVARPLPEERVEFWFEIGNRQYTYRDPKLRVSVYGLNCEATLLASHIIVPGTQKELGFGDTLTEVEARRNGTTNEKLSLPCGKGRNLYKEVFHFPSIRSWTPEEPWALRGTSGVVGRRKSGARYFQTHVWVSFIHAERISGPQRDVFLNVSRLVCGAPILWGSNSRM